MTNILGGGIRKAMLGALLVVVSTAVVTQACAETLIIQGSTTFARRVMEPHKGVIEADAKHELTLDSQQDDAWPHRIDGGAGAHDDDLHLPEE